MHKDLAPAVFFVLVTLVITLALTVGVRVQRHQLPPLRPQIAFLPLAHPVISRAYAPQDLTRLYKLPTAPPAGSRTPLIALVDAYNDPHLAHDLAVYSAAFDLPPCPKNSCLRVVGEHGGRRLPPRDRDWALEESLDVEITHGLCPPCRLLLVEADAPYTVDLGTAVDTAVRLGATEVSNSYGGPLATAWYTGRHGRVQSADHFYDHPGVAVVASAGDAGYGAGYPAAAPDVISVGGTALWPNGEETAWSGSGGGCTVIEKAPPWQRALPNWDQTHCWGHRAMNDLSADASVQTGAQVYDSTPIWFKGQMLSGWWRVGGTSLASPLIAAMVALAGGVPPGVEAPSILYRNAALFRDVTVGEDASHCPHFIDCHAAPGYDLVSGLGAPRGIAVFQSGGHP